MYMARMLTAILAIIWSAEKVLCSKKELKRASIIIIIIILMPVAVWLH